MKKIERREAQKGIAIFTVLLVLLLLSALAVGLMYMTSTETQINYNFRSEQLAYFAARAGLEEVRDRMMAANPNGTIAPNLPTAIPSSGSNIYYILNPGDKNASSILPWDNTNPYFDTDLCHDGYPGLTATATDVPCKQAYSGWGSTIYTTSTLPWKTSSAALPYKWARVSLKVNGSVPNRLVDGSAISQAQVCWNGTYELALPTTATKCSDTKPLSSNPVYLITALAVTKSGARKMVQGEVALNPAQPFPYGLFATGSGCGALSLGGGAKVDSYNSANGPYSKSNSSMTAGEYGSNGNTLVNGGATIGGSVVSPINPPSTGTCPSTLSVNGNSGGMYQDPGNLNQLLTIPLQNVTPPVIANTTGPNESNVSTLPPGNYGDIKMTKGTLTIGPGTYNVTSMSLSGQAVLSISGAVTINIVSTSNTTPLDLEGGGVTNDSKIASNLQINYAGTSPCNTTPCGTLKVSGGNNGYMIIYAPNSDVMLKGTSDIYGSIIGNQIDDSGGVNFHYDTNTQSPLPSNGYYSLISFRDLYY